MLEKLQARVAGLVLMAGLRLTRCWDLDNPPQLASNLHSTMPAQRKQG